MDKLKMQTTDGVQDNISRIAELFPECITEVSNQMGGVKRSVDFDKLRQLLSSDIVEGNEERYQFTWPDKRKAILAANAPISATLRPCPEESVNFDTTQNLYIEGDNLNVLKCLKETYLHKVKMIYIDPPYNTGNDFVYKDDFAESASEYLANSGQFDEQGNRLVTNTESNGRFHTDWLNMIYPRLKVARDLLTEDGVIFISIDDNEVENLKKVCDEIFGEINHIGLITVVANPRGRDYGGIARMNDYILCYQKSLATFINLIKDKENEFKMFDNLGGFELRELRNRNIKFNKENRPNLYYPFYINPDNGDDYDLHKISLEPIEGWIKLYPLESQGINTVWRWGKEKAHKNLNINIMAKPMKNGSYMIVEKYREARRMARSVWWDKDTNTEKGTLLVKELFEGKVFDYPKPVEMLSRMLEMGTEVDSLILDFFSGSATTAHAVMQLNAEDGGNRKYIMVQLPELTDEKSEAYKAGYKNICEIGKERIRRAGAKIKADSPLTTQNLDTGFRVLKLDSSNMKEVFYSPKETTQQDLFALVDNVKDDRTSKDLLFQVMLELGATLDSKIEESEVDGKTIYNIGDGYLVACFDQEVSDDVVKAIAKMQPTYAVLRDTGMADDATATNFEQIFKTYAPNTTTKIL